MVKRILVVILIVLSLSLLLSIEPYDTNSNGEDGSGNVEEKTVDDYEIKLTYNEEEIEVRINNIIFSNGKYISGTKLQLQQTIITATSKIIGHDAYREYYGKMVSCSSGFVPQDWEIKKGEIIFSIGIGSYDFTFDGSNTKTCKFNESITMPEKNSTTKGYTINNWKYNNSTYPVGYELYVDESFLKANSIYKNEKLKFKSVMTPIDYKTAYDLNGGLASYVNDEMTINLETPITMPDAPPVKDGFSFKCWKIGDTNLQCGDKYNLIYSAIDGNGVLTITAQWTTTVIENLTHCTLITTNSCVNYGENWSGTLKPEAHYMMPPYISSDCVYTQNPDGTASIAVNNVIAPINIIASAIPIEHTVKLDPNEGNLNAPSVFIVNEVIEKELPTPTKEEYIFDGWYNDTTLITNTKNITSDCTLKALWKKATSSLDESSSSSGSSSGGSPAYSGNSSGSGSGNTGGSGSSSSGTSSGGTVTPVTPVTPVSPDGNTTTPVTDPAEEIGDTEITDDESEDPAEEKEIPKTYEHRFYIDESGKIWRIGDPSGITDTPSKEGYTFGGWFIIIDGEWIPYTDGLNIDTNVFAKWIPIKTDGDGNPMIPAAAIASVLAVVLIVLVTGRKID